MEPLGVRYGRSTIQSELPWSDSAVPHSHPSLVMHLFLHDQSPRALWTDSVTLWASERPYNSPCQIHTRTQRWDEEPCLTFVPS